MVILWLSSLLFQGFVEDEARVPKTLWATSPITLLTIFPTKFSYLHGIFATQEKRLFGGT